MKDFKVTVTGETGSISYEVRKTAKGAESFGKKVAAEAFYGESCTIVIVEIAYLGTRQGRYGGRLKERRK